jgi:hypothetical protein
MRSVALIAAVVTALAAAHATAAPESDLRIRPGQGIGKLRLGMMELEARRAMGQPWAVVRRPAGFGLRSIEYQYDLAAYTVRFVGVPGRLRAVRVSTIVRGERTPKGIGPGSLERSLRKAYPGIHCARLRVVVVSGIRFVPTNGRDCTLTTASGRRTVFRTSAPLGKRETLTVAKFVRRARVAEVVVATGS